MKLKLQLKAYKLTHKLKCVSLMALYRSKENGAGEFVWAQFANKPRKGTTDRAFTQHNFEPSNIVRHHAFQRLWLH